MAVPGRVPAISLGSVDSDSVFVSFQDGASSLPITRRQIVYGTNPTIHQAAYEAGGNTAIIGGLASGTTYYFWARVANADGWGPFGGPVSATTTNPTQPPGQVPAISIGSVDYNSVFVSFQDGASVSPITVRQIAFGYTPDSTQFIYNTDSTVATISGLQSGMRYYFQARVGNQYGWGPWSANVTAVTDARALPPDPVPAISVSDADADSVFVSFALPGDNGTPINVRQIAFSVVPGGEDNIWNPGTGTTAVIKPLQPNTTYYFKARVGSNAGWGGWSYNVSARTTTPRPPGEPPAISASDIKHDQFFASMRDPGTDGGAPITSRQFGYGTNPTTHMGTIDGGSGTAIIRPLAPNTQYYLWARVGNRYGWSSWAGPIAVKTTPTVPSAPGRVVLRNATETSVDAEFPLVTGIATGGSPILEYQIGYGQNAGAPERFVTSDGSTTIEELTAGMTYYFWARARNAQGWGLWSIVTQLRLRSTVMVFVNGIGVDAIPYINVGGTWRLAQPWTRLAGFWRK